MQQFQKASYLAQGSSDADLKETQSTGVTVGQAASLEDVDG